MKLRYEVKASTTGITVAQLNDLREHLREFGEVIESIGCDELKFLVLVEVEDVVTRMGEYGPSDWAREAAELPIVSSELVGTPAFDGASRFLEAAALDEWWAEHTGTLQSFTGNEAIRWPEAPEVCA